MYPKQIVGLILIKAARNWGLSTRNLEVTTLAEKQMNIRILSNLLNMLKLLKRLA